MKLQHIRDGHGDNQIHKAGCAHIKKYEMFNRDGDWIFEAETRQDAANEVWSDFIAEESMTTKDALGYTNFAPCVTIK